MRNSSTLAALLGGTLLAAIPRGADEPRQAVTVSVAPGARQTFSGFGASEVNGGRDYQKLTPPQRRALSRTLWHDLRFRTLRLWLNLDRYAPARGAHDLSEFRGWYVASGLIADAKAQGVTTLLLAPDGMPGYMKAKRAGGPNDYALQDNEIDGYTALLADAIRRLQDETHVRINVTGVQNEPNDLDRIAPEQVSAVVKSLRRALDARGLRHVTIIAPETANVDGALYDTVDRLKADPDAWGDLAGIASHSYNNATTPDIARRVAGTGKQYWMTEASDNGPEAPGNAERAASLASRFLGDVNRRVTHWVHFIGFEVPDPNDNSTRILAYTPSPFRMTLFQKYYYYRQLSHAFDVGAVFRASQSSLDGDMVWTYGKKPRLTAAAARNPDGSWAVGLSNYTSFAFRDTDDPKDFALHNSGYPARTFTVTVRVPELARVRTLRFAVRRSNSGVDDVPAGTLLMHSGEVTVPNVGPLDLLTLRSQPIPMGRKKSL